MATARSPSPWRRPSSPTSSRRAPYDLRYESHLDLGQGVLGQVPYSIVVASEQTDAGATTGDGGAAEGGAGDGGEGGDAGCQTGDADGGQGAAYGTASPRSLHLEGMGATNSVSLTIGEWTVGFNGSITGGALDIGVTGTYSPTSNVGSILGDPAATLGGITTQVSMKAHVNDIQGAVGALNISGGSISSANMSAPITGSADMSAQMSTMMGSQYPPKRCSRSPSAPSSRSTGDPSLFTSRSRRRSSSSRRSPPRMPCSISPRTSTSRGTRAELLGWSRFRVVDAHGHDTRGSDHDQLEQSADRRHGSRLRAPGSPHRARRGDDGVRHRRQRPRSTSTPSTPSDWSSAHPRSSPVSPRTGTSPRTAAVR